MNELTKKIYDLLKDNNIDREKMLETLRYSYKELEVSLWENITISQNMFCTLKDTIWYNLEHLPNGGEEKGVTSLKYLGIKFPNFIYSFNESNIIENNNLEPLLSEINEIIRLWDRKWKMANLYTNSLDGWQGGKNASKVIIYDSFTESPTKYGYNRYSNILDSSGKAYKKMLDDTVLCELNYNIGEFSNGQILYNILIQLKNACSKSLNNKRDVRIIYEETEKNYFL